MHVTNVTCATAVRTLLNSMDPQSRGGRAKVTSKLEMEEPRSAGMYSLSIRVTLPTNQRCMLAFVVLDLVFRYQAERLAEKNIS